MTEQLFYPHITTGKTGTLTAISVLLAMARFSAIFLWIVKLWKQSKKGVNHDWITHTHTHTHIYLYKTRSKHSRPKSPVITLTWHARKTKTIKSPHLLSSTVRVYSLVAPCRLPDLTSLAPLGSVSGQPGLSRGPLPGYKRVSKWWLQLQDSTPFLLLSQRLCTTLHTSASLGCYLLFTHMPDCPLAPLGQAWQQ